MDDVELSERQNDCSKTLVSDSRGVGSWDLNGHRQPGLACTQAKLLTKSIKM